jgi:hypothetical protein
MPNGGPMNCPHTFFIVDIPSTLTSLFPIIPLIINLTRLEHLQIEMIWIHTKLLITCLGSKHSENQCPIENVDVKMKSFE